MARHLLDETAEFALPKAGDTPDPTSGRGWSRPFASTPASVRRSRVPSPAGSARTR